MSLSEVKICLKIFRETSRDRSNEGPYRKSRGATRKGASRSWSEVDPEERTDYDADIHFSDEEGSELAEVSEETCELLISACTRSVSNEERPEVGTNSPK